VAPTETLSLLKRDPSGPVALAAARWWLTPHWAREISQKYAMFNARAEGLEKSPAFRKPFASQRGIVPMTSFIEWRGSAGGKQPWLITNADEALAVAALWDLWSGDGRAEPLLSCTLVTTDAAPAFRPWHGRMPVMLTPPEQARWLDNDHRIEAGDPLFRAAIKEPLRLTPIDRSVGNARNKSARVLEAVGEVVELSPDAE
jgi:putative SOS response-associated peptidase YedK